MTAVATSLKTLWSSNRDQIITRALRICGAVGQGVTPNSDAITEGAEALNDLMKELAIEDGMPLWKIRVMTPITLTATATYVIGIGSTSNQTAPLKILQAWTRDNSVSATPLDSPCLILSQNEYNLLQSKQSTGTPNQVWYNPPGPGIITVSDLAGTLSVYPVPDSYTIANKTMCLVGQVPFDDFSASTDIPDCPSYWYNAIKWLLAVELSYEYGVGATDKAMIAKMAEKHKSIALMGSTEQGSLFLRPTVQYSQPGGNE